MKSISQIYREKNTGRLYVFVSWKKINLQSFVGFPEQTDKFLAAFPKIKNTRGNDKRSKETLNLSRNANLIHTSMNAINAPYMKNT